jgi:hypothetical protein
MAKTYTKKELESLTVVYDYLQPVIADSVKRINLTLNPIKREVNNFADKNANVLQTNIIGKQLLFNETTENAIRAALNVNLKEFKAVLDSSPYYKQFGNFKLKDQLLFSIPLILLSIELEKAGKTDLAMFIFTIAYYKPYASVVYKYFGKYPVNEDQMLYTIENLSERYDIKKYGTLQGVIEKKAELSFQTYIKDTKKIEITDHDFHQTLFGSGIYDRLNKFVKEIMSEYQKNKGKYLPFETMSDIADGGEYSDKELSAIEVKSDAASKEVIYRKAVNSLSKNPIDIRFIEIAVKYAYADYGQKNKLSVSQVDTLKAVVSRTTSDYMRDISELIESVLSGFLTEKNKNTNARNSTTDIYIPVFLQLSLHNILNVPNISNRAILKAKSILEKLLTETSDEYVAAGNTKKQKMKKALLMYFLLVIQKG